MTARDVLTSIAVCSGALLIIVQAVKQFLPERYMPYLPLGTVLFGIVSMVGLSLLVGQTGEDVINAGIVGLFGGGSAVGFYDTQRPAGILPSK